MGTRLFAFNAVRTLADGNHLFRVYIDDDATYLIEGGHLPKSYHNGRMLSMMTALPAAILGPIVATPRPHAKPGIDWSAIAFVVLFGIVASAIIHGISRMFISRAQAEIDRVARELGCDARPERARREERKHANHA